MKDLLELPLDGLCYYCESADLTCPFVESVATR